MYWIALQASPDEDAIAWAWHALQFTPRVALVDEAILLEAGASERLFGGRRKLLRALLKDSGLRYEGHASGATALVALALLRVKRSGHDLPEAIPDGLPLATFSAAQAHLGTLERIGCHTLGQLQALPRQGVGRRFGSELLAAMDAACGLRPERYEWLTLPAAFDQKLELPALATSAPDLMLAAQHLLTRLQAWLQARNLGVLALELEWTLDLRRLDGKELPPCEQLQLRTAQATQDMRHLRRLASEQLARSSIAAPANHLRLRTLETVPWGGSTVSLLQEEHKQGERLHELVERLSVRLGEQNVTMAQPRADHRPERMQQWLPARGGRRVAEPAACHEDALLPTWLLRAPVRLPVRGDKPSFHGPLHLLTLARRIEAAWWDPQASEPVLRDYFIARSDKAGLLWIYRERLSAEQDQPQWFLHGLFA